MRVSSRVLSFLVVLFSLLVITTTSFAAIHTTATPKARVTARVDDSKRTTLHGHVPPVVQNGIDMGRVESDKPVEHLILVLRSDEEQKREIRRIVDEQQDKRAKNYHQWVTPEEFGEHFGVHDADIAQVTAWLTSHGLTVDSVNKSKRSLRFSGTVGQLEKAFQTEMHYLLMPNGETHVSNTRDITIPSALKEVVSGIPTLNDFFRKSHKVNGTPVPIGRNSRMKPGPRFTSSSSSHLVSAADFATIYNSAPLLAQGINGSGIKIGIVGRSDILLSDVETYRSISGLPANDPNFIHTGQDVGLLPGDDGESDLDVEISGGVAPNATVDFVIGTPTFLVDGITNSFEYLIENNLTDIISSSYGDCESNEGAGGNLFNAQLFEQAAAQGISVFIAEGDNGPAGCDDQSTQTYEVLGYASGAEEATWYSVGVGGTEFYADGGAGYSTYWNASNSSNLASAIKYIPEYPWNEAGVASPSPSGESSADLTDLWSASGAVSAYYLRPPWQTGSGINNSTDPALTLASGATGNWVASVNITNPGSGYTTAPTVTFGSGCSDAPVATSVLGSGATAGQVIGLTFTGYTSHFHGFNCTSVPSVTFSAPTSGTTALGTAVLGPMQNILPLISGVPHRLTPDLSLNASSGHDGTVYCDEGICDEGYLDAVGGTSVAAPSMAGVQALIDQANGGRQGMPAYIYYQLANKQSASLCNSSSNPVNGSNCAFQDVTLGNNFICGQGSYSGRSAVCSASATSAKIGFAAGTGFDLATGLGSPNVANLANQWSTVTFNSSNTTLGLSSTSFQHGTSVTLSGAVAAGSGSGTPTGDVAFIVSQGAIGDTNNETTGAQNGPVAFATLSGGSYSATLNNLPGGTYYVTARYGGDDNFASSLSAGVQVTVSSEGGGVTITPYSMSQSACTITPTNSFSYGSDTLINVSVAGASGNGAPTGSVALTLDSNPWTTLPLDPNGNAFVFSGTFPNPVSVATCEYEYLYPAVTISGGAHTIGATYSGDNSVATATATPASITVSTITPGTMTLSVAGSTSSSTPAVIASGATVPLAVSFPLSTTTSPLVSYEPMPGASGPTGTVTFTDTTTSTVLGTATLNPYMVYENEGTSSSALPVYLYTATGQTSTTGITTSGSHTITASYSGDANYSAATATGGVTVGGTTATTVAVTASANPTTLAGVPTLTATVTTATAGTVTFFDGTTVLGQGSTVGTAHTSTLKISSTYPFVGGSHSITAVYSGTGTTSRASTSPVYTENVTQGTMTIDVSSKPTDNSSNTFSLGAVLNCATGGCGTNPFLGTATDFSNVYSPVLSNVNFYDGATLLGSAPATVVTYEGGGSSIWFAQLNVTLSAGSHSITAQYSDVNYASATSSALALNVTSSQTLSWTTPPPTTAAYGSSFTVAASASSGLTPTYTSFGKCTNSGATYTMTSGTGTCLAIVSQAGNSSYGAAPQIQQSVSATLATNTVTFTTPAPASAEYGASFTVAASGLGTGAITYTSDGVVLTNAGATYTVISSTGTGTVGASQAADSNYAAASATPESVTAEEANAIVSVTSPGPSTYGQSVTFTATVSSDTGAVKGRKTTKRPRNLSGSVTWSSNTGCSASSISGNPPQTATCSTSILGGGTDSVTATFSDSNHNTGTGSFSQTVNPAANTVTFTTPAPGSAEYGSSFTVAASGLGTGAITYTSDGVVCTNSGATYTMISGTGTCTVTATQAADANYQTANASESVTAEPAQGSVGVSLTSGSNPSIYGQSVTFTATVTSDTGAVKGRKTTKRPRDLNGSVAWSGNTGCSASGVSGNPPQTATCTTSILGGGTDTVTATYTANDSNHTTASGSISQTVNANNNTVTFTTPAPASAEYGSSFTVAASGLGTGAITYTSDGVVCTNSGATYTMISGSGTCTVTATQAADNNYNQASASESVTAEPAVGSVSLALTSGSNPSVYGSSITFTATVTSDTGAVKGRRTTKRPRDLNGSVAWSGNTGCSANSVSGNPPQTATCTTSILGGGTDSVTATYTASDSNHTTANASINQTVNQATNTVTFTTPAPASAEYGSSFTVAASGLGTGAITYTSDGVVCTNSGATYTMIQGTGTCTVTATQAADANYLSANTSESVTAEPAVGSVSVALTTGSNPSTYGGSVTFTATVTSDTGAVKGRRTTKRPRDLNGSVSWSANTGCSASSVSGNSPETATCTTSILGAGSDTVTATYTASDSNHTTASGSISQTVNRATATVALSNLTQTYTGSPLSPTVTTTPSGLSYSLTGAPDTNAGSYSVTATITDPNYAGSASGTFKINKASQTITVTMSAPATAIDNSSFTIAATASSGLPVSYTSGGSCTNSGGTYTIGATAAKNTTCTEDVFQTGNTNYNAAIEVTQMTTVVLATTPTLSFVNNGTSPEAYGATFTVTASSTNDTSVPVITTSTGTICQITGSSSSGMSTTATVQMLSGTGGCALSASWAINTANKAATKSFTVEGKKVATTVNFTGAPATAANGSNFTVTATSNSSATPTITSTTATVCTVGAVTSNGSGGYQATVTMIKATGTCKPKAAYAANDDYNLGSAEQSTTATH